MLHAETNEGQRKIGCPRKIFRQCLIEDLKSFNIAVEDFNKIALDRKKKAETHNSCGQNFQLPWANRCLQASAKRHAHRIKCSWFWIYFATLLIYLCSYGHSIILFEADCQSG